MEDYVGFKRRKSYYRLINLFDELEEESIVNPNGVEYIGLLSLGIEATLSWAGNTHQTLIID